MLRWGAIILILSGNLFSAAGNITSLTGPTQITRAQNKIAGAEKTPVEMLDVIETLQSRVGITFVDDTKVNITEHSKFKIDEFVYDPSTSKGKLTMKATLGTVRYASGKIAKNSRENVNVTTPTASIAVRGTDFSMSVDEMGKSLIILLPGADKQVGQIEVSNMAGTVLLDKAFQGTVVTSAYTPPSPPVVYDIGEGNIGNDLLLDEPKPLDPPNNTSEVVKEDQSKKEAIDKIYAEVEVIERTDNKFAFKESTVSSTLKNIINGQVINLSVPRSSNATVDYFYPGGAATAKNGTGGGISITIIQR
jgi:hypothetical protein